MIFEEKRTEIWFEYLFNLKYKFWYDIASFLQN